MTDTILTLNAGSSSVKFRLFARDKDLQLLAQGKVGSIGTAPAFSATNATKPTDTVTTKPLPSGASHEDAMRSIIDWIHGHESGWRVTATAHRIVHGGTEFTEPLRMTSDIFHRLKKLCPLAPLHQPHNLMALGIADRLLPHVPQIACFDTAFHARHDPIFTSFALPRNLTEKGVRRYGFHGLSYEWIAHVLRQEHPELAKGRVIAAHLGNGASLCAMQDGRSIDTTMGMTALDGLPMGTRCGALDPGAMIYMLRELGTAVDELESILYEQSGLKGLSGISNDVKTLLESRDPHARFALDYFALRTAQFIAALAVSVGGIDALIFTGGIGENAAPVREAIIRRLAFLGPIPSLVIPANEERIMAMQASACLETPSTPRLEKS